jgi:transcriptional regulator with XRE-family HTH domain
MILTGEQLRAARAMVRLEQSDLAAKAGVSVETIKRLERTIGPVSANVATMEAVTLALEAAGAEFTNNGQPGVRPRLPSGYTDAALLTMLDQDQIWIVRGAPNPLPATAKTLREALVRAADLESPQQKLTSIRSAGDRIIISVPQFQRLWSRLSDELQTGPAG